MRQKTDAFSERNHMTERVWLKSYPAGIPADIDITGYESVLDFFDEINRKYADKPAFSNFGKFEFARLDEMSQQFAGYLQKLGSLSKGDPRCHHDAESAAISSGSFWRSPRRHDGGQYQPAVRRERAQLKDSGKGNHRPRKFCCNPAESRQQHVDRARHHFRLAT